jgi:hypothetical protein
VGEGDLGTVPLFLSQENRSGSGEGSNRYIPTDLLLEINKIDSHISFDENRISRFKSEITSFTWTKELNDTNLLMSSLPVLCLGVV